MKANQDSPGVDGQVVRELHPAPGALPAIIALTADAGLTLALQELAPAAASLTVGRSVAEFSERLVSGASGIALIDAAAVPSAIQEFVDGVAAQFPELVLVVAGGVAEQSQLAAQIGGGRVYRFVHKPASAQRLKLFIEAAARHHAEVARLAAPVTQPLPEARVPAAGTSDGGRPALPSSRILIGAVAAAVLLVGGVLLFVLRGKGSKPAPAPVARIAVPVRDAAAEQREAQAKAQIEVDRLLASAETALTEARLDDAERLAVAAQSLNASNAQPGAAENSRVRFLQTQIARERERLGDEEQRRSAQGLRQTRLAGLLRLADERMTKGSLLEPARDSALYYIQSAADLAPNEPTTVQSRGSLIRMLLAAADRSLGTNDIDTARRLTDAAAALDAPKAELDRLRRRADELHLSSAAAAAAAAAPPPLASAVTNDSVPAAGAAAGGPSAAAASVIAATSLTRTRYVEVKYPEQARLKGQVEGWVDLEFTVATDGAVKDLVVIAAQPRDLFEVSTATAVRRWRYAPVIRNGVAVEQRARLRVRFAGR